MLVAEDKVRMSIESFDWKPEIDEPGYKVQGTLFGNRAEALQLNWPSISMPELIEVFNDKTGRMVTFRQRGILHSQDRYYSMNPDYLIEIYFKQ
jgi:hypothetical protein